MVSVRTNCHRSTTRTHVQPCGLLLGFCSWLAPFGSFAAALTAKSGRDKPTCVAFASCFWGGVPHLKKSSTVLTAATGGLQSFPWRYGLSVAETLSSNSRSEDATSSPQSGGYDRWSRTAVKKKKPRRKDL